MPKPIHAVLIDKQEERRQRKREPVAVRRAAMTEEQGEEMKRKNREKAWNRRNANEATGPAAELEIEIGADRTAESTLEDIGDPCRVENRAESRTKPQIKIQHGTGIG